MGVTNIMMSFVVLVIVLAFIAHSIKKNRDEIVEEAVESGIKEIGIIVSMAKPSIAHHFSVNEELEKRLLKAGKSEEAKMIHDIAGMVK